jgi:hypothetical protein
MKKVTSIMFIIIFPLLAVAQPEITQEDKGFLTQLLMPDHNWLIYLSLLISLISLLIQFFNSRRLSRSKRSQAGVVNRLNQEMTWLKNQLPQKAARTELQELEIRLNPLVNGAVVKEEREREKEWNQVENKTLKESIELPVKPEQPDREIYYAKMVDLDNGFSAGMLSTVQNGEQVYEIQTSGDTAIYRISTDSGAQKYALVEFTYTLGKACELSNQPFKGCQIVLQKEGSLAKIAGDWIIQSKAIIQFK